MELSIGLNNNAYGTKELKTVNDFQVVFAKLALECKEKFGAEKISVYISDDGVDITFR